MTRVPRSQLLFYARYSENTGLGHVVRSAALSAACRLRGARTILLEQPDTPLPDFCSSLFSVVLPEARAFEAIACDNSYLVVDSYAPDKNLLGRLRNSGLQEVWICDDLDDCPDAADFVLNATFNPNTKFEGRAKPLLGTEFALLRPSFAARRAKAAIREVVPTLEKIFVSLGGTDPNNLLPRLVSKLLVSGYCVTATISDLASNLETLQEASDRAPDTFRLITNATDSEVAEEMLNADVTIGNAGSSSFERCTLGIPTLMIIVADNQVSNAKQLVQKKAAVLAGRSQAPDIVERTLVELKRLQSDLGLRREMSSSAFQLCDGLGAFRAAGELIQQHSHDGRPVRLRPVTVDDSKKIYDWQQIPETRAHSRNPKPPTWSEHLDWFENKIIDPRVVFSVVNVGEVSCGVVRLDYMHHHDTRPVYEVSIFLHPDFFGKGIAAAALRSASLLVPFADIQATVLPDNERSLHLFKAAGYVDQGGTLINPAAIEALEDETRGMTNERI